VCRVGFRGAFVTAPSPPATGVVQRLRTESTEAQWRAFESGWNQSLKAYPDRYGIGGMPAFPISRDGPELIARPDARALTLVRRWRPSHRITGCEEAAS
jgi:hypothetical protein